MPVFKAEAAPEPYITDDGAVEGYWIIRTVIDDRHQITQAKRHVEIHGMAADLISCYLDIPVDDIAIQVKIHDSIPSSWIE